jgi:hypothetical protein
MFKTFSAKIVPFYIIIIIIIIIITTTTYLLAYLLQLIFTRRQ